METYAGGSAPKVDLQQLHRQKNCADCRYFCVVGVLDICRLYEISVPKEACPSFIQKTHDYCSRS